MREWLKQMRLDAERTQAEIAKRAGISPNYYCYIEHGERGVSVENAKKIAEALGFDWTRFYDDTG